MGSLVDEQTRVGEDIETFRSLYQQLILPTQINASASLYKFFRNLITRQYDDYEDAKILGDNIMKKMSLWFPDFLMKFDIPNNIGLDVDFYGQIIHYNTPVSLASYEGDLEIVMILAQMGTNFTKKTAMHDERPGNEKIRMAERVDGFENAMGLPGPPAEHVREELDTSRFWEVCPDLRMTLSVGGSTKDEYLDVFHTLYDNASYLGHVDFEINVSCPNTDDGQKLCEIPEGCDTYENLDKLLEEIREIDNDCPIYVKLSPDFADKKILELAKICKNHRMGIVLANTKYVESEVLSTGGGGYSGPDNKEQ